MKLMIEVDTDELADPDVFPGLAKLGFTKERIDEYVRQNENGVKALLADACLTELAETMP